MSDDVVTELDGWLAANPRYPLGILGSLERARDEIVALRARFDRIGVYNRSQAIAVDALIPAIRAEALEEAAQRCDRLATDYTIPMSANNWSAGCRGCAGRIRALKEKP